MAIQRSKRRLRSWINCHHRVHEDARFQSGVGRMSATIIAGQIVAQWDELSKDSIINREEYIRNLLVEFHIHIYKTAINDLTKEIKKP